MRIFTWVALFSARRSTGQHSLERGLLRAAVARDVRGLLDELQVEHVHMLGYSMGGGSRRNSSGNFPIA
jgi:pimeloyl-ACP methyl ester carboxylesterase